MRKCYEILPKSPIIKKNSCHFSSMCGNLFFVRKIWGIGPIPHKEYCSWGIFLARFQTKSSHKYSFTRNIPREKKYCEVFSHSYFLCEDSRFVRNIQGTAEASRLSLLVSQWGVASVNITGLLWSELAVDVTTVLWRGIWIGCLKTGRNGWNKHFYLCFMRMSSVKCWWLTDDKNA